MAKKSKAPKAPKTQNANSNIRKLSKRLFSINVILEGAAAGLCLFCVFFMCKLDAIPQICAFVFLYLIFAALIPDFMYAFLMCKLSALGIDPLGVCFNFLIGVMCILIGLSVLTVLLFYSDDMALYLQVSAGVLTILSGFLHLCNGIKCQKRIPLSEKYYRPKDPLRQQLRKERKRMKKEEKKNQQKLKKEEKKAGKQDKKGKKAESV